MKLRGYIFSRPFLEERVPQHVQNIIIRDYCKKNNYEYLLSATEYAMPNSEIMLRQIVNELDRIDGIIAYSVFQLPQNNVNRSYIIKKILEKKKEIHFACESIYIKNLSDFEEKVLLSKDKELMEKMKNNLKRKSDLFLKSENIMYYMYLCITNLYQ